MEKENSPLNQNVKFSNNEEGNEGIFDGRVMKDRMRRFLQRINEGLKESQEHLPDFEIQAIEVNTVIGLNGEFTFPMAGGGINYSRAITFQLKPKRNM